jgi:hypothetical protein
MYKTPSQTPLRQHDLNKLPLSSSERDTQNIGK